MKKNKAKKNKAKKNKAKKVENNNKRMAMVQ